MSANIMSIIAPLLVGFILKDPVSTELQFDEVNSFKIGSHDIPSFSNFLYKFFVEIFFYRENLKICLVSHGFQFLTKKLSKLNLFEIPFSE